MHSFEHNNVLHQAHMLLDEEHVIVETVQSLISDYLQFILIFQLERILQRLGLYVKMFSMCVRCKIEEVPIGCNLKRSILAKLHKCPTLI